MSSPPPATADASTGSRKRVRPGSPAESTAMPDIDALIAMLDEVDPVASYNKDSDGKAGMGPKAAAIAPAQGEAPDSGKPASADSDSSSEDVADLSLDLPGHDEPEARRSVFMPPDSDPSLAHSADEAVVAGGPDALNEHELGNAPTPLDLPPTRNPIAETDSLDPDAPSPLKPTGGFALVSDGPDNAAPPAPLQLDPGDVAGTGTLMRAADARAGEAAREYVFCQVIGEGGHGRIWRAWQTSLSREVAVKVLIKGDRRAFLREAYASAALDHPNILPIYDLSHVEESHERRMALSMKMVRGTPWNVLLDSERRAADFDADRFLTRHLKILIDVCNAVAFAHSKQILHRDLKPHQVMVGRFGEVYLMDWGMALSLDDEAPPSHREGIAKFHTRANGKNQCGTPAYMAPEQTERSLDRLGPRTDVYLLGATLFEIVSANPPHDALTAAEAYDSAKRNEIGSLHAGCPSELREIVLRSLATEPAERFASAEEFRDALMNFLSGSDRRRESRQLVEQAIGEMSGVPATSLDYAGLSRYEQRARRALALWPENQRAVDLLSLLQVRHAEKALTNDDLQLADSILQAMEPDATARSLLQKRLTKARARQQRDHVQRRVSTIASLLLLIALAALMAQYTSDQRLAQIQLESERDRARHARDRAEDLVSYLLTELPEGLEPLGRIDLLEDVSRSALAYYDRLPDDDLTPESRRQRAAALRLIGVVLLERGQIDEAQKALVEALSLARGLLARTPDHPSSLRLVAETLIVLGQLKKLQEVPDVALTRWGEAASLFDALVGPNPSEAKPELLAEAASLQVQIARLLIETGDLASANAAISKAEPLAEAAVWTIESIEPTRESAIRAAQASTQVGRAALLLAQGDADSCLRQLGIVDETIRTIATDPTGANDETFASYALRVIGLEADVLRVAALTLNGNADAALEYWEESAERARSLGIAQKLVDYADLLRPFRAAAGERADAVAPIQLRERWQTSPESGAAP